jgi:hypothetical protein
MPFRLPKDVDESKLPPLRWRRGPIVDVDSEHRMKLLSLGAEEVSRDEAAEVIEDSPKKGSKATSAADDEKATTGGKKAKE